MRYSLLLVGEQASTREKHKSPVMGRSSLSWVGVDYSYVVFVMVWDELVILSVLAA